MAAAKKTTKPVAVATPATEVKAEVKKVETPAAEVKAVAKKETAKKAPAKKETVKKETKTAATKTATKKAPAKKAEMKVAMEVQFADKAYTQDDLVKIAKDVWKYDLKQKASDLNSVELYVKPEENTTYYVINGNVTGSFFI